MTKVLAALVWCCAVGWCQPPVPAGGSFSIDGQVLDANSGEPIARAQVTVRGGSNNENPVVVLTGPDGMFHLTNVPAGSYSFSCERTGYIILPLRKGRMSSTNIQLSASNAKPVVTMYLMRQAVIEGTVLDDDSAPIPGTIQTFRMNLREGRWSPAPTNSSQIDPAGGYRVRSLPPGRYYVSFRPEGGTGKRTSKVVVYPAAPDTRSGQILEVAAGSELRADFRIATEPGWMITGKVFANSKTVSTTLRSRETNGLPVQNALYGSMQPDHSFRYEGVPMGDYVLEAQWSEGDQQFRAATEVSVGAADVQGVVLQGGPIVPLKGVLRYDGTIVEGQRPCYNIELRSDHQSMSASLAPDGTLTLSPHQSGDLRLRVQCGMGWRLESATQEGRDIVRDGLHAPAFGASPPFEVRVTNRGGKVEVEWEGGAVALRKAVMVALLGNDARGWFVHGQTSLNPAWAGQYPGQGKARFDGVPPGDYLVFAWLPESGSTYQLPYNTEEFHARYGSMAVKVRAESSATASVSLSRLLPPEAFEEP